jgi:hypothetical protein
MKACFGLGLGVLILMVGGCGPPAPGRLKMKGKVSFEGKPVAAGQIYFKSKEERPVLGAGIIKDGEYQTAGPDYGPVSGPQEVRVQIYDGKPEEAMKGINPHGHPVAPDQVLNIELAPGTTSFDFILPVKK